METGVTFGEWLKQQRRRLDLTQKELAHQVGCSLSTLRKIEANERQPSKELAEHLARCLKIESQEHPQFIAFARSTPYLATMTPPTVAPPAPPPWQRSTHLPANVPAPLTPLLGRDHDVAALGNALRRDDTRLLTLIGPPGVGKTRLSLQVAAHQSRRFNDGVYFVELAPVSDPHLVIDTLARTVGVKPTGQTPPTHLLTHYLRDKQTLLILDNFEHVLPAAPLITGLLENCPHLKILVTSRASLGVLGEQQFPLSPLLLPNLDDLPLPETLVNDYPAVALFVARSQAIKPDFVLTPTNAPAVAAICVWLDGLPLAIELAAAWSKVLRPQELVAQFNSRLSLLREGPADLPARQRTLRAAVSWSYDLLNDEEQALLRRLSVFVGGCTLSAAKAVAGADREPTRGGSAVLTELASLVNKSLLLRAEAPDDQARFSLLGTIREFALEQLNASAEHQTRRQRHAAYFLALAERTEPELRGPRQLSRLSQLEAEHNNLRAALLWLLEQQQAELALRLCGALWRFWELHSYMSEGRVWLEKALALAAAAKTETVTPAFVAAQAKALNGAGKLANNQGDHAPAERLCQQSLALWQSLGPAGELGSLNTLHSLGLIAQSQGDFDRAAEWHRACLTRSRAGGDRIGAYLSLFTLAEVAMARGNLSQARQLHEESLALKRDQGDLWSIAWSLSSLALLAGEQGDFDRAGQFHRESLVLRRQLADKWSMAESLTGLAGLAAEQGHPERAARLLGAAETLLSALDASLSPLAQQAYDHYGQVIRDRLDQDTFSRLSTQGSRMSLDEAIDEALKG